MAVSNKMQVTEDTHCDPFRSGSKGKKLNHNEGCLGDKSIMKSWGMDITQFMVVVIPWRGWGWSAEGDGASRLLGLAGAPWVRVLQLPHYAYCLDK